jgi:5'-nucleotidase/UDP-sugar diphosphatase
LDKISKTTFTVTHKKITNFEFELIDLRDENLAIDCNLEESIAGYFDNPEFHTNIGSSISELTTTATGCFYTDALQKISSSDMVTQYFGGIRDVIYEGTITPFSIYAIAPFGNSFDTFSMTIAELRNFLNAYSRSFTYLLDASFSVQKNSNEAFTF